MLLSFAMIEPLKAGDVDLFGVVIWVLIVVVGVVVKASKNAKARMGAASVGTRRPLGFAVRGFAPSVPAPEPELEEEPAEPPEHVVVLGSPFAPGAVDEPALPPLRGAVAPSRLHALEHVAAPAPEGTVPPPASEPAPTAAMEVHMPMSCPAHGKLPRVKLPRTAEALRTAMVFNEIIGRPRAYDV